MNAFRHIAIPAVVLAAALAGTARAEDTSAKQMKIKDNADASKKQIKLQISDAAIDAADGYAVSPSGATLIVYSRTTWMHTAWFSSHCTGDGVDEVKCVEDKSKLAIKPASAKVTIKGDTDPAFELDALQNQLPIVMVLSISADAGSVDYCAVCGNGSGTDEVSKNGSDGKQVLVKNCDAIPCPSTTKVCCDTAFCLGGAEEAQCMFAYGGTPGATGSVCDDTGNCVAPPGEPAGCCEFGGSCGIGSAGLCQVSGGIAYSNASTCQASGACTDPPTCTGYATQCRNRSECVCSNDGFCIIGSMDDTNCTDDFDCPQGTICTDFQVEKLCREPCY